VRGDTLRSVARVTPLAVALLLGGCRGCPSGSPPIHLNPNMDRQPKLLPQAESGFFADGAAMRPPVPGTVPQGQLPEQAVLREGRDAGGAWVAEIPLPVDAALLARGEERYGVFCGPCHGPLADGKGMLFQRAQVQSADLRLPRFRDMASGQIFDAMTNGVGLMPAYGAQVPARDRWAILAFLRQLQAQAAAEGVALDAPPAESPAGAPAAPADAPPAAPPATGDPAAPAAEGNR
jgi:mono/diheme cytochrome c family protein